MKSIKLMLAGASLLLLCSCSAQTQKETQAANANESKENAGLKPSCHAAASASTNRKP